MFVLTAKLSKSKLIAGGLLLAAAVVLIVLLACSGDPALQSDAAPGSTNEERIAYLASFGWSVDATPTQVQNVRIPDSAEDQVFSRYNELQRSQGFDLTAYAGQEVTRYVYALLNYPNAAEPVYATLLVLNGQIIGGDITDTAANGVIHGFRMPTSTEDPHGEEMPTASGEESLPTEATAAQETPSESSSATEEHSSDGQ